MLTSSSLNEMGKIPRKDRFFKAVEDESAQSCARETANHKIVPSARRKIQLLANKHHESELDAYGEAHLFFATNESDFLDHFVLRKRCITVDDCVPGRTYMDFIPSTNATWKDEFPLIAYSNNGTKWRRGYLITLCVKKTYILGVNKRDKFDNYFSTFKPMEGEHLVIKYINLVDETMRSASDGALFSKTTGPDMIHINQLPELVRKLKKTSKSELYVKIPLHRDTTSRTSIPRHYRSSRESI